MIDNKSAFRYAPTAKYTSQLERELASRLSVPYAVATSSCTSALFLAIKSLGISEGSLILTNAFTFIAVPSAVVQAGCIPILCEVDKHLRLDINKMGELLARNKIAAILVSNIRGHISDMDSVLELAGSRRIPVIEDAAHCFGATWRGKAIGTLGDVGCFSFQSYKMVRCGEGGALVSRRGEVAAKATVMSGAYEDNYKYHLAPTNLCAELQGSLPSFNCRLSELCSHRALTDIQSANSRIKKYRNLYKVATQLLKDIPEISIPDESQHEYRAPDSIQFFLVGVNVQKIRAITQELNIQHIPLECFGAKKDNARCFWNWRFLPKLTELPLTRKCLEQLVEIRFNEETTEEDLSYYFEKLRESLSR